MKVSVSGPTGGLTRFGMQLERELDVAVRTTGFAVERDWKLGVPVDTGAYRASIYTINSRGITKRATGAGDRANARRVKRGRAAVPILSLGVSSTNRKESITVAGVDYARHVENRHPTKAFAMAKAAQKNRRFFRVQVARAIQRAGGRP